MSFDFPQAFADIATAFSAAGLGAFHDAEARWPGTPVMDDGGSIVTPGTPVVKTCQVQVDQATEAMRASEGFADGDMRMLVLAATLDGALDTAATIEVLAGPHQGTWMVAAVSRDPCGVYFECRGRRR
ncbi:hypothetical protein GCM10023232_27190 [Sphingosinicella ginsenosidimutans]|uniref:Head-tail adaptor protein n=1 Tax=Allosphingosinicella ginsenosidimutans TaxID=1176539 RepID=A0A5C6TVF7_9SPHN|nr:hypothetical protein [Sphingosinicella ginsenosidimutans]TXC63678.1 hypothetical protein FRZ32_08410 [Sphingosinicella ginsenosidimutans]